MTNKIDTVIFDLDGTLVDSQPAALGATIEALSLYEVRVTAEDLREVFGGGARRLVGHFLERDFGEGRAGEVLEEVVNLRSRLQLDLTGEVILLAGVRELLDSLKEGGFKLAVATMSSRVVVNSVLDYHGIQNYFDATFSVDDVSRIKPDPEILTKTIDRLGRRVDRAIYVGDSSHDLEAASDLGMSFILVDSGLYVRGEARKKLRAAARKNGFSIVGLGDLAQIGSIVRV
ncbi:MAG: HAD family hydrolase [Dehalococcoidia bacterium]|nr:HAD family hydrolase [Dehalococcoidia bacterium]